MSKKLFVVTTEIETVVLAEDEDDACDVASSCRNDIVDERGEGSCMNRPNKVVVSEEFTTSPGARYYSDGPKSGEEFRETLLLPRFEQALTSGMFLEVVLDGTDGYATSFLEEAFGGLARLKSPDEVLRYLKFVCYEEPGLPEEIEGYIREARR